MSLVLKWCVYQLITNLRKEGLVKFIQRNESSTCFQNFTHGREHHCNEWHFSRMRAVPEVEKRKRKDKRKRKKRRAV